MLTNALVTIPAGIPATRIVSSCIVFGPCDPATVHWSVIPVVVLSPDLVISLRAFSHVSDKVGEIVPSLDNLDTSSAIRCIRSIPGIVTAGHHPGVRTGSTRIVPCKFRVASSIHPSGSFRSAVRRKFPFGFFGMWSIKSCASRLKLARVSQSVPATFTVRRTHIFPIRSMPATNTSSGTCFASMSTTSTPRWASMLTASTARRTWLYHDMVFTTVTSRFAFPIHRASIP